MSFINPFVSFLLIKNVLLGLPSVEKRHKQTKTPCDDDDDMMKQRRISGWNWMKQKSNITKLCSGETSSFFSQLEIEKNKNLQI